MKITILGSCRQDSLYTLDGCNVTSIKEKLSYPHYTKEILQVVEFCKSGNVSPEETVECFRTPIMQKKPIYFDEVKDEYKSTQLFFVEIASRIKYVYKEKYVHHILYDHDAYCKLDKEQIQLQLQSDEEIIQDVLKLKEELNGRLIIVGHIVTYNKGSRYDLLQLLEKTCVENEILFIHPVKEIEKEGYSIHDLIHHEKVIAHYTSKGHEVMQKVYKKYITTFSMLS